MEDLLTTTGQLTDLTIDRYLVADLSPSEIDFVEAHLSANPDEQTRLNAVRDFVARPLPPLTLPSSTTAAPEEPAAGEDNAADETPDNVIPLFGRRRVWAAVTGALAAAAAILLIVNINPNDPVNSGNTPGEPVDTFYNRGQWLEVVDTNQQKVSTVFPNQRLMFKATAPQDGYFMVLGVDGKNNVYAWHPRGSQAMAEPVKKGQRLQPEISMRMDDTPGVERIVGVICPKPFRYADLNGRLAQAARDTMPEQQMPSLRAGCVQTVFPFNKGVRP